MSSESCDARLFVAAAYNSHKVVDDSGSLGTCFCVESSKGHGGWPPVPQFGFRIDHIRSSVVDASRVSHAPVFVPHENLQLQV